MFGSWRKLLPAALGTVVLLAGAPAAAALDRSALAELETLLRDLGFDPGDVDGVVDDDTLEAIRRYKAFALLPGDPAPNADLLGELRGVAAAFAALNAGREDAPTAALAEPAPAAPAAPEAPFAERPAAAPPVAEKVIVPPPPPPPKLIPPDMVAEDTAVEEHGQVAALPPAPAPESPPPAGDTAAEIDAELAPYRADLESGDQTPEALARQFNDEGRQALQRADYGTAILKFSVAIHLDPGFAGAYSNRGTAYQRQEEPELAAADFAKAKELGFGGFRIRDGKSPFK